MDVLELRRVGEVFAGRWTGWDEDRGKEKKHADRSGEEGDAQKQAGKFTPLLEGKGVMDAWGQEVMAGQ